MRLILLDLSWYGEEVPLQQFTSTGVFSESHKLLVFASQEIEDIGLGRSGLNPSLFSTWCFVRGFAEKDLFLGIKGRSYKVEPSRCPQKKTPYFHHPFTIQLGYHASKLSGLPERTASRLPVAHPQQKYMLSYQDGVFSDHWAAPVGATPLTFCIKVKALMATPLAVAFPWTVMISEISHNRSG